MSSNEKHSLKIAMIGLGAIGGVSAGFIKQAGYNIQVVCKYPELAKKVSTTGLKVQGVRGEFTIPIPAVAKIEELTEKKDLYFIAVKAHDLLDAARAILPYLNDSSRVICMENGIVIDAVGEIVGQNRTVGCVTGWGSTMHALGIVEMTSTGEFVIGKSDNQPDPFLPTIKTILDTIVPCSISTNIYGSIYSKMLVNSCITSLGALCGLYLGEMLALKKVRNIFIEIIREGMAVANAWGIKVEIYGGKLDYYQFVGKPSDFALFKQHLLIRFIGFKYRRLKSSSLQSLERGKPTEIDYFNGYISKQGKRYGVATPVNDKVVQLIKEIEAGRRSISVTNFAEFK